MEKILILDEDTRQVPEICDYLRTCDVGVKHITKWQEVSTAINDYKPTGIIVDLMIPPIDLPVDECEAGYTSGVFIYINHIQPVATDIPFIIYSAAFLDANVVRMALKKLEIFSEYRGVLEKGCDEEMIINTLFSK